MAISFSEFAKKKVLGVPVLYIAAAAVTILAVIAWRLKPAADTNTPGVNPEDGTAGTGEDTNAGSLAGMADPYSGFDTNGTVVVQPTSPTGNPPVDQTNDDWLKAAIPVTATAMKLSQGTVQSALSHYLDGDDLSFDEGQIRDTAIEKNGLPPEGVAKIGIVNTAPAQKQFTVFPGKHTVKGSNDNTASKLAYLYYGSTNVRNADNANQIAAANPGLGPPTTTYNVGTVVVIPFPTQPRYWTVTKDATTFKIAAAKNGVTVDYLRNLNPGTGEPLKVGSSLRVN